eukprot:TRINITY_DN2772_c0_g2_i2.p2 TRINITY_DN2772_c0_g2~~TRINITY_DN2772_c0_g2_i2.p2  ORF type:complete len:210 (-),score=41.72 TRINITY_DN2772_c0_g2_i2:51-680(-)
MIRKVADELKVAPLEVFEIKQLQRIFPSKPFFHQESKEFFYKLTQGDYIGTLFMLEKNRFYVYDFDFLGRTALHIAVYKGHDKIAQLLIDNLADINAGDIAGRTPLFVASKHSSIGTVKMLLRNRADPSYKTKSGQTALHVAHTVFIKDALVVAMRVHNEMRKVRLKKEREVMWKNESEVNFASSVRDSNDIELASKITHRKKEKLIIV